MLFMALIKLRITILLGAFARVRENQKKGYSEVEPDGYVTPHLNYTTEVLCQQLFSGMQPAWQPRQTFYGMPHKTLHRHEGSPIR